MAIEQNQDYVHTGDIDFQGGVKISTSPTNGYVLTTDGSGNASWQAGGSGVVLSTSVTLSSADILSLHTTPITLVAAQGANTFISVVGVLYYLPYNSIIYATDTTLRIQYADGNVINTNSSFLAFSSNALNKKSTSDLNVSGASLSINSALQVTTPTSNPTAGNSTVKITVLYSVINL